MRVAVIGGTGTLGSVVVAALQARGHEVRRASRSSASHPVDLSTGAGLREVLDGCAAVVDASNGFGSKAAQAVLIDGSRRLLEVESAVGVAHHVVVSIVGCDKVQNAGGFGYYRAKVEQEEVVRTGPVPWTLVRATQFHDLLDTLFAGAAKVGIRPSVEAPLQPVDVGDVAHAIADAVDSGPVGRTLAVAGPQVASLRDLGRTWSVATGHRRLPVRVPAWGPLREVGAGALVDDDPDVRGMTTFASWLKARYA
ncbi:NAD(P)H-binding protein [Mumia sp. zg.B21]|uniref:SDR family oxidoreductase n=1 Tax=Mumia sp. zg.B21 TaxID=2855447 RepID=UPI001C6EF135|nr:NAD(P)H-binding protein [Mumia sp. zg.B21]MBW9209818.1 NAD(P)H-binding protein [Mumia sp. zg.B21]